VDGVILSIGVTSIGDDGAALLGSLGLVSHAWPWQLLSTNYAYLPLSQTITFNPTTHLLHHTIQTLPLAYQQRLGDWLIGGWVSRTAHGTTDRKPVYWGDAVLL
jgi:hypothetical protein